MKVTLEHGPAFAWARVALEAGEAVKAESGAMVSMSTTVDIQTKMQGGFLGALARKVLTSLLLSGEGLVCRFSGQGRLWLQTRSLDSFVGEIIPRLPTRSSN